MKAELYTIRTSYVHSRPFIFVVLKEEGSNYRIEFYGNIPEGFNLKEVNIKLLGKPDQVLRQSSFLSDTLLPGWLQQCIPGEYDNSEEAFVRFCACKEIERDMLGLNRVRVLVSDEVSV